MAGVLKWFNKKMRSIEIYVAISAISIISLILLAGPITGVANNGDYNRIMTQTGLEFITDSRFVNIDQYFKIKKNNYIFEHGKSYLSSHLLPVIIAIKLNEIIKSREKFDIRFLGSVYSGLFVISVYLIAKNGKTRIKGLNFIYAVLLVIIFCDIGYVAYFNSFLGEAATMVFLLLMLGTMASVVKSKRVSVKAILCFFISSVLYISAKQSNVPMGVFIAIFTLSLLLVDRRRKVVVTLCFSTMILIGLSLFLYLSAPANMEMITKHQTVFYGILKDSPTPEEDLKFLGLPKSLTVLKETSYFDSGLPIASDSELLKKEFYNKLNFGMVLKFYLYHPLRFLEKLEVTAKNSMMIRPPYLGNFKFDDTGERFSFNNEFSLWSTLKKTYMPASLPYVATFFTIYFIVLLYEYRRAFKVIKDCHAVLQINMFLLLWLIGAAQFVIPVLGDGEVDLAKHMFSYNVCFDMMLISAVIWILSKFAALFQKYKRIAGRDRHAAVKYELTANMDKHTAGKDRHAVVKEKHITARQQSYDGSRCQLSRLNIYNSLQKKQAFIQVYYKAGTKWVALTSLIILCSLSVMFFEDYIHSDDRQHAGNTALISAPTDITTKADITTEADVTTETDVTTQVHIQTEVNISDEVDIGDYLKFGRYGGEDIVWQVIYKDSGQLMIMADKIIGFKSYDVARSNNENPDRKKYGSNNWETSALRTWLNSGDKTVDYGLQPPSASNVWKGRNSYADEPGFLYEFTKNERNIIKTITHKSIISSFDADSKEGGRTYYFWTNCIPLLVQNYNDAYYQTVIDKVFLLDVKELKEYVYDNGLKCRRVPTAYAARDSDVKMSRFMNYWLRTPYATRSSFVRYVGSDGYVYHKDAYYGDMGVLPVLYIAH